MKAITIRQPFAHLVVTGIKTIETRKWLTTYRGPILIHASRSIHDEPVPYVPKSKLENLPLRAIIGMATLTDCMSSSQLLREHRDAYRSLREKINREKTMGHFGPGWFAWKLEDACRFKTPIPCIGSLNIWTPPQSVLERVAQLTAKEIISDTNSQLNPTP